MFLALAQLTNKAFTDAGKGRIRQLLTALVSQACIEIRALMRNYISWFKMKWLDARLS